MKFIFILTMLFMPFFSNADDGVQMNLNTADTFLVSGLASSCFDFVNLKADILNKLESPTLAQSISSLHFSFKNFSLNWHPKLDFSVTLVRVTVESDALLGGIFTYNIYDKELESLIGGRTVANPLADGKMSSSEPARDCSPQAKTNIFTGASCVPIPAVYSSTYAECGLEVGGLKLASHTQKAFSAPVKIELFGVTTDGMGGFNPVYTASTATLHFNGVQ